MDRGGIGRGVGPSEDVRLVAEDPKVRVEMEVVLDVPHLPGTVRRGLPGPSDRHDGMTVRPGAEREGAAPVRGGVVAPARVLAHDGHADPLERGLVIEPGDRRVREAASIWARWRGVVVVDPPEVGGHVAHRSAQHEGAGGPRTRSHIEGDRRAYRDIPNGVRRERSHGVVAPIAAGRGAQQHRDVRRRASRREPRVGDGDRSVAPGDVHDELIGDAPGGRDPRGLVDPHVERGGRRGSGGRRRSRTSGSEARNRVTAHVEARGPLRQRPIGPRDPLDGCRFSNTAPATPVHEPTIRRSTSRTDPFR